MILFTGTLVAQENNRYKVVAVSNADAGVTSESNIVEVKPDFALFIPNAFTPNADGLNDIFIPVGSNVEEMELTIFNRWGEAIFTTTSLEQGWDGTYLGENSPSDVYVYDVKAHTKDAEYIHKKGNVTLIR